jgi:uncharacterized protein YcfJ
MCATYQTRKFVIPALILALFNATPSMAGGYSANTGFQDTAWVVASTPVYESTNEPRRECWDEQVGYDNVRSRMSGEVRDHNVGGAILGGILGGVLGNTIGKGDGRKAATAIGIATGAVAGDNYGKDDRDYRSYREESRPRYEQRCRSVDNWSRKLTGYNVTYRYQGHEYSSFMPYDPGRNVRVNVSVSLADR